MGAVWETRITHIAGPMYNGAIADPNAAVKRSDSTAHVTMCVTTTTWTSHWLADSGQGEVVLHD